MRNRRQGGAGIRRGGFRGPFGSLKEVPETIADLAAWWRADSGVTLDTGVSAWVDKTGVYTASQGTGSQQPAYDSSDANFGGEPSLNFASASSQFLRCDAAIAFLAGGGALTSLAVIRRTTSADQGVVSCGDASDAGHYYMMRLEPGGQGNQHIFRRSDGASTDVASTTGTGDSDSYYFIQAVDGAGAVTMRTDGSADGTGTNTRAPTGQDVAVIGALERTSLSNYFNGDIAELIFYTRKLETAEMQSLEAYVAARYGI